MSTNDFVQDSDEYYIRFRGKVRGPLTLQQLQRLRKRGQLSRAHELSTDRRSWQSAAQFREIFSGSPEPQTARQQNDSYNLQNDSTDLAVDGRASDEEAEWHYYSNGEQNGPVTLSRLQSQIESGTVGPDDLVWKAEFSEWQPVHAVPELATEGLQHSMQTSASSISSFETKQARATTPSHSDWMGSEGGLVDTILEVVRESRTADDLQSMSYRSIQWGGYAMAVSMLVGPAHILVWAIKQDSIMLGALAFGVLVVMGSLKYVAQTMSLAAYRMVDASTDRVSSYSILKSFAMLIIGSTIATAVLLLLTAIRDDKYWLYLTVAQVVVVGWFMGCIALRPEWLGIEQASDAQAGEEGLTLLSIVVKLLLRFAPFNFGVGAILGAIGLTGSLIATLLGEQWHFTAINLATGSSALVANAIATPIVLYVSGAIAFILIDIAKAILSIPRKCDRIASSVAAS